MGIKLGDVVTDRHSGFAGVVVGRAEYDTGCVKCLVVPQKLGPDGKLLDEIWFDEQRLTGAPAASSGGPMPLPPRS